MPRTMKSPYRNGRPGMRHLWLAGLGMAAMVVRTGARWTARMSKGWEALQMPPEPVVGKSRKRAGTSRGALRR